LNVLRNYFDDLTKLLSDLYLTKFSAKSFFPDIDFCRKKDFAEVFKNLARRYTQI